MKQINKNIFWNAVGNTAYNSLQWLITVMVTRRWGFDAAGVLAIAMSVSLTLRTVSYFGIRNFQVTDSINKYSCSDYFGLMTISSASAFILCALVSDLSGYDAALFAAVMLYMLFRVSESFSDLFQGIMQKSERLDIAGICLLIKAITTTAAFAVGFYLINSLNAALLLMSVSAILISFLFELPIAGKCSENQIKISFSNFKQLAAEAAPMFVYTLESALLLNAPKYFLSIAANESDVGIYSSVFSMALILQGAFQYIYVPFITKFSVLNNNKNYAEIKKLAIKIICVFMAATLLFSAVSVIFGKYILTFIFGNSEYYGELILPAVLSVCSYSATTFISEFAIIKRRFSRLITAYALGIISFAFFSLILFSYGISSVSFSLIIASILTCLLLLRNL